MATLQLYHSLINTNPGLLKKIRAYFESMVPIDEQDQYTIYQVEKTPKIGDIQILVEFEMTDLGTVVSGHRPAYPPPTPGFTSPLPSGEGSGVGSNHSLRRALGENTKRGGNA